MKVNHHIPFQTVMLKPQYWGAWLVVFFMWLISFLPLRAKHALGKVLGTLLYLTMKGRTKVGRKNLSACFPEKTPAEIEVLLKENMQQMAIGALECTHAWWADMRPYISKANIIGIENLLEPLSRGQGVLMMGGHFAAIDFNLPLVVNELTEEKRLGYMYRPHDNPVIDRMIVNGRNRENARGFSKDQVKDLIKWIKDGQVAWYACDQNFSKASTLFAPFFGVQAANLAMPTLIARRSNAVVVFLRMHRLKDGVFEIEVSKPLENFGDDPQQDCEMWNQELEKAVRMHPSQYFWVHKRFKKRPPGEPKFY